MKSRSTHENGKTKIQTINHEESKTQQQFKDDCDVNKIMAKYVKDGFISHVAKKPGVYADLSSAKDYHESMLVISDATSAFNQMPSKLRERFNNDPAKLLAFLENPNNKEEAIKLGLLTEVSPSEQLQTTQKNTTQKTPNQNQQNQPTQKQKPLTTPPPQTPPPNSED